MKHELIEDLVSQKTLLREMNSELKNRLQNIEKNSVHLNHDLLEKKRTIEELREDKKVLADLLKSEPRKRILRNITIIIALGLAVFIFISYIPSDLQSYYNSNHAPLKTLYLIQNLKSNTMNAWRPWHIVNNQALNVNIVNPDKISKEKITAIKEAILSEESVKIDNSLLDKGPVGTVSTYYKGWQGAMQNEPINTKFHIPNKFNIIESPNGEGDITITLSSLENPDGYSRYTKTTIDDQEILKASIIIYNVNNLTPERLADIVRHEFGHALGLGHSSDQEDLMYQIIQTNFPFISDCDINTVNDLYAGKNLNQMSCGQKTV